MFYQRDQRGVYVLRGMEVIALSGDAHTTEDELYKVCHRENRYLTYSAVELALSSRLSLILGGAGSGKTTLVRAIMDHRPSKNGWVLCSPTGKAARNLTDRTGFQARTVHSALGMHPDEDFLSPVAWAHTDLVIVDEASMMTLEMLAGILCRAPGYCHIVLLGDPNQLLSVGAGNVIPNLLELGVPICRLECSLPPKRGCSGAYTQCGTVSQAALRR